MPNLENLIGKRFGSIVITERVENFLGEAGDSRAQYIGDCDCGYSVVKTARDFKRTGDRTRCYHCGPTFKKEGKRKFRFGKNANGFTDKTIVIYED